MFLVILIARQLLGFMDIAMLCFDINLKELMVLTKAKLVEKLVEALGVEKREAKSLVELFFKELCDLLEQGQQLHLSGFGSFNLRDKKERPGRNPRTGKAFPITPRRVVTFRAGQKLKSRVEKYAGLAAIQVKPIGSRQKQQKKTTRR